MGLLSKKDPTSGFGYLRNDLSVCLWLLVSASYVTIFLSARGFSSQTRIRGTVQRIMPACSSFFNVESSLCTLMPLFLS